MFRDTMCGVRPIDDQPSQWRPFVLRGVVLWWGLKPVLLEVGTRFTILNPLRSRSPERTANLFLRAASAGTCLPEMSEVLCGFVRRGPLPANRVAHRRQSTVGKGANWKSSATACRISSAVRA